MAQLVNQFAQTKEKGQLDAKAGFVGNILQCRANASLIAGQAVKIVDVADGIPNVDAAGDTDEVFGYVVYGIKNTTTASGAVCEIALEGNIMFMIAGAAFAPGVNLMHVAATGKVITATGTTKYISARALDKAAADADVVRCYITAFPMKGQPAV